MHNWADLQITAICEIHAAHWKQQGRADIAGAFKRAAHLAFESAARWQRPSGELWIIKNRAEPEQRLAYERYSNHSQYNLLPMAMLAIAYDRADESIVERPAPAEVGGYVFDARETFHKVAAAAGGYYVLIDTQADPHYNATGLQRVHKAGVLFPALSDSAATERAYGSADIPKDAIAPGIEWLDTDGQWIGLADFSGKEDGLHVRSVTLESQTIEPDQVIFTLRYELADATQDIGTVTEQYRLNYEGVSLTTTADLEARRFRAQAPMLVNDGAASTEVSPSPTAVSIKQRGAMTTIALNKDSVSGPWNFTEPRVLTHNGYVIKGVIDLRSNTADFIMTLSQEGTD
jgi:hypothetical protein